LIALLESRIEEAVTDAPDLYVSTERTTTSLAFVVENPVTETVEPEVHVPVPVPSSAGAGASAKSWNERTPAGIEVAEANCGDQRYMLDPAGSVNELSPWTASQYPEMLEPDVAVQPSAAELTVEATMS
jgi:hypothetical protein